VRALLAAVALATRPAAAGPVAAPLDAVALVVVTPGMERPAFLPLVAALECAGFDAWTVEIPPDAPLPPEGADREVAVWIRAAAGALRAGGRPTALVGHGPGATLALMAAPGAADAVVALGPLLGPPDTALSRFLAALPVPEDGVDLGAPLAWGRHDAATLLLGSPPPPLGRLPAPLARDGQRWLAEGPPLDPAAVTCPVYVAAAARDRFAPVESIRGPADRFHRATFVRFGILRFDHRDPGSADLLSERAVLGAATRWLCRTLAGRTP